MNLRRDLLTLGVVTALALAATGCKTDAFCFADCDLGGGGEGGGGFLLGGTGVLNPGEGGPDSGTILDLDSGTGNQGGAGAATDDSVCDGLDNDGDGEIDEDVNFASPVTCGTCDNSCLVAEHVFGPECEPPDTLDGSEPGQCGYERCETDFYDIDPLVSGCEYYCPWNPNGDNDQDLGGATGCGADDDCDGEVDEDVPTCSDVENCGACGHNCVTPNAVPACVTTAADDEECTAANTACVIERCDDGWFDADHSPDNGCEYQCTPTGPDGEACADPNDCPEVCDGRDNDCDKLIDNADPSLETEDAQIGAACAGGTQGACAAEDHQGVGKCIGGQIQCCDPDSNDLLGPNPNFPETGLRNALCDADTGPQVIRAGELDEVCNGDDDDCDGTVDNNLVDAGSACGVSGTGLCNFGILQCQDGTPLCLGAINPTDGDACNGKDDDCDGVIDGTLPEGTEPVDCVDDSDCSAGLLCLSTGSGFVCALPPVDWTGICDEPPALPAGSSGVSGCLPGVRRCVGGTKQCSGATRPVPGAVDTCGVDADCNGQIDAEADLLNDVHNCGACGNDCTGGSVLSNWTCVNGTCEFGGCVAGRIDCDASDGPGQCERRCTKTADTEQCNGLDDDCDCFIDSEDPDGAPPVPSPVQACGVSSTATEAACTTGVTVACTDGAWRCTFPAGYCTGAPPNYCAGMFDPCDGLDNNCSGIADEQFVRPMATASVKGEPCPVGIGACQRTGTFQCDTTGDDAGTRTECVGAEGTPAEESCNGLDDDCDGSVDETFIDPGTNPSFVKPAVVKVDTSLWMFAYEASRPDATATSSGAGNGYFFAAPPGETVDSTAACSVSGRLPWVNVTPWEVEQVCDSMGGRVCDLGDWKDTCRVNQGTTQNDCFFGFSNISRCQNDPAYPPAIGGPYCNLGPFDSSTSTAGNQDALLATGALASLGACSADWTSVTALGNTLDVYDITGNAREIVRCQRDRAVCAQGVTDAATAANICAIDCCAGTSQVDTGAPAGYQRVCGDLNSSAARYLRRLSGQDCSASSQCCDDDDRCSTATGTNGTCSGGYCRNQGQSTTCRTRGVNCGTTADCCDGDACVGGICGGPTSLPHAVYPLLGGSYATASDESATCDFDFFKVEPDFKLFDSGFRCCFDSNPSP